LDDGQDVEDVLIADRSNDTINPHESCKLNSLSGAPAASLFFLSIFTNI